MRLIGYLDEMNRPVICTMTPQLLAYCRSAGFKLLFSQHARATSKTLEELL